MNSSGGHFGGDPIGIINLIPPNWGKFGGHLQVILIGSSNWGTFEGDLGGVHWIPSKCGMFGGHLGGDLVN